MEGKETSVLK